jgi:hypothetical protein
MLVDIGANHLDSTILSANLAIGPLEGCRSLKERRVISQAVKVLSLTDMNVSQNLSIV